MFPCIRRKRRRRNAEPGGREDRQNALRGSKTRYNSPLMKILFVGGGSIGHIAPSVAVWEQCRLLMPDAACVFVCSPRKEETNFLAARCLPHATLDAPRLSPLLPWTFLRAMRASGEILDAEKPDVVFGKGGYVSLPLCIAAWRKKIPVVLHESDTVSGYANSIIRRFADAVCMGFADSPCSMLHSQYTGNPVRQDIARGSRDSGLAITGLSGMRP